MADTIDDSRYFWKARTNDGHTLIGFNDAAREEFGEISSVRFLTDGPEIHDGQDFLNIESPNTVSDSTVLHAPDSGQVIEFHTEVRYQPHLVNSADRGKNWLVELY